MNKQFAKKSIFYLFVIALLGVLVISLPDITTTSAQEGNIATPTVTSAFQNALGVVETDISTESTLIDYSLGIFEQSLQQAIDNFVSREITHLDTDIRHFIVTVQYEGANDTQYIRLFPANVYESNWTIPVDEHDIISLTAQLGEDETWEIGFDILFLNTDQIEAATPTYSFPWTDGQSWAKTQGFHFNNIGYSIDFAPRNGASNNVLAIEAGTFSPYCYISSDTSQAMVLVTHSNGDKSGYLHIDKASIPSGKFSQSIPKGTVIGSLYTGSEKYNAGTYCQSVINQMKFATPCGCGTSAHLHFETNSLISIQDNSLSSISAASNGTLYTSNNGDDPTPPNTVIINPPSLSPVYSGGMCGSAWYRFSGYNGQYAYLTLSTNDPSKSTNSASWRPTIPVAGTYKVEAYIANHGVISWECPSMTISADTSDARYTIYHANGTTTVSKDQLPLSNDWLNLGTFAFNTGTSGKVELTDLNGETHLSRLVSFSAVRFTLIDTPSPTPTDTPTPTPTDTPTPTPTDTPTPTLTDTPTSTPTDTPTSTPTDTPTPTLTDTPTPTPTDTPIPTPVEECANLSFEPASEEIPLNQSVTVDVHISDVTNLYGTQLEISFDPKKVQVVDADPDTTGVQITPGSCPAPDFVVSNTVNNTTGTISYSATSLSPSLPCDGNAIVASITFEGVEEGTSPTNFTSTLFSNTNGESVCVSTSDGSLDVVSSCTFSGTIDLQGRPDDSGATFTVVGSETFSTTTDASGYYELAVPEDTYDVTAEMDRYLDGERTGEVCLAGEEIQLPSVTLLGGDTNDDCVINILDLSFMGSRFMTSAGDANYDPRADINADGTVNILDLSVTGGNFMETCPVNWP